MEPRGRLLRHEIDHHHSAGRQRNYRIIANNIYHLGRLCIQFHPCFSLDVITRCARWLLLLLVRLRSHFSSVQAARIPTPPPYYVALLKASINQNRSERKRWAERAWWNIIVTCVYVVFVFESVVVKGFMLWWWLLLTEVMVSNSAVSCLLHIISVSRFMLLPR